MKKTVLVAVLLAAASVMPVAPAFAAPTVKAAVPTECFFLPLLPNCITAWKAEEAKAAVTTKTAAIATKPAAIALPLWTCKPAAVGAGHLYDCSK